MTNKRPRYLCGWCKVPVRRIGKHTNHKHPGLAVSGVKLPAVKA